MEGAKALAAAHDRISKRTESGGGDDGDMSLVTIEDFATFSLPVQKTRAGKKTNPKKKVGGVADRNAGHEGKGGKVGKGDRVKTGSKAIIGREKAAIARENRAKETRVLSKLLQDLGLCLVEIPADGHCLFSAIGDQLRRSDNGGAEHNHKSLRRMAAEYMRRNEAHFRDFLSLEKESFETYCGRIEKTNAWGGQHEIIALCHVLRRNIEVGPGPHHKTLIPTPQTLNPKSHRPQSLNHIPCSVLLKP